MGDSLQTGFRHLKAIQPGLEVLAVC
jgi:hypothetical protein